MVGAKAAGHHGVPETNPSPDTSSKKLSSAARGSTVQFYVRQRKKKGRVRSRVKLVLGRKEKRCIASNMLCVERNRNGSWFVLALLKYYCSYVESCERSNYIIELKFEGEH